MPESTLASAKASTCRLCGGPTTPVWSGTLLGGYPADYVRCGDCDLLQVVNPFWLKELDRGLVDADTGAVQRNLRISQFLKIVLDCCRCGRSRMIDYGGGSGLLTRLMRDAGVEFLHHDPYSANVFARGFEYEGQDAFGVTLFEVLEHVPACRELWEELADRKQFSLIVAGTECPPVPFDPNWWYLLPDTGQHVVFYSPKTFEYLARRYGYHYSAIGGIHVLARRRVPRLLLRIAWRTASWLALLWPKSSLTQSDHRLMLHRARTASLPPRFSDPPPPESP